MYDTFEHLKQLNIQEFTFKPNRYEIWKDGQKIDFGRTSTNITAVKKETFNGTKAIINFNDSDLFSELSSQNEFDLFLTQKDRLQLLKIPSSGNGDSNSAITILKMTIGATRKHMDFQENQPYCCNLFFQDARISKITFSHSSPEKLIEFYSDEISNKKNKIGFTFNSSTHLRYENGIKVSETKNDAPRALKVEPNLNGGEGYSVTLFNTDNGQVNVQMAPKQMKIKSGDKDKLELIGFGTDPIGFSYADYGLTVYQSNGKLIKCILHIFDRNIKIEYLK